MEPKFIKKDAFQVVGLEVHSSTAKEFSHVWMQMDPRWKEIENRKDLNVSYGLIEPTGGNMEFNYIVCAEVTGDVNIPEGMVLKTVPANDFAIFTHKGSLKNFAETWQYIYGTWLPQSGYKRAQGSEFEMYETSRFCGAMNDESEIDIYIPIIKAE
ncbi:GyrI-like domain-containing protein [Neobacillus sp. PS3-34]|uniref:GyrI-like domain-containing protein n=1 Tax=Neobacillus sp. PS3-34 TaxID=3070678 RepID=UPI0027E000A3|nr:GyrI-like domain-containing protein [Neobacillus sp. PS3-34]WML46652.1 GyrI-like domain-containing protein [Neobacillus sp. PS3-34]